MLTDAAPKGLQRALADERERDLAATNDTALVSYQRKWERKLARLQRAHPQRWRVPGLSDEEVRDALTLRLIEAIRELPAKDPAPCRSGKEWGLCVAEEHLCRLRRSFRLGATPTDFARASLSARVPSQEEHWLELEEERCRVRAGQLAEEQLSRPQRRWLDALKSAAHEGEFFEGSQRLNLSAASRRLGMNRSSASRADEAQQARFSRELDRQS
jgi:hypothetical protein